MTIWRMPIHAEYLSLKHASEYIIFTPFPLQQWLQERASMLRKTYIAYLVRNITASQ